MTPLELIAAGDTTSGLTPRARWRAARDESTAAYGAWSAAPDDEKRRAYIAYLAALDREGAAADDYARAAEAA